MTSIKLKFVHAWVDRRRGGAKARFWFRRRGFKPVPLPGLPGSAEFNKAYADALAGQSAPAIAIGADRTKPGTIDALAVSYFKSAAFLALAPLTQSTYRTIIEAFRKEHGSKPVALLTRQHIEAMLARKVATPAAANHWLRLMKVLLRFAKSEGMRKDNPAADVAFIKRRSTGGFHTWTEGEIKQFEARHPIGTKARLALGLLLYTAQRRSDVVCMGPQDIDAGRVRVRQKKTGKPLSIRMHPELRSIIDATTTVGVKTFIVTDYGKPFTAAGFGGWFRVRDRCNEAGLPQCSAHGLRKAACRRLAEAGCSAKVIASISGHVTLREVQRYCEDAEQATLADIGMAAIIPRTS
jgi:integrase